MKSRPSLFEVMNKAPQPQGGVARTPRLPFLSGLKRGSKEPSQPVVAKALSEEEAAAELAARRAAIEAAERAKAEARERLEAAKEAKRLAKLERKAQRQAAKEAARQQAAEVSARRAAEKAEQEASRPVVVRPARARSGLFRNSAGRFVFSLSTASCMVVAGGLTATIAVAYLLGHRSANGDANPGVTRAAAIAAKEFAAGTAPAAQPNQRPVSPRANSSKAAAKGNLELEELLTPPAAVMQNVAANQPQRIENEPAATPKKRLNYVQIEWFKITVEKSSEDLLTEVEEVHRFLKAKGIDTFARAMPRGFILYSKQGYPMSDKYRSDRDALQKQIEQLGQEYFRGGGRYQFKDCFFVSSSIANKGQPVSFKE